MSCREFKKTENEIILQLSKPIQWFLTTAPKTSKVHQEHLFINILIAEFE